MNRREFSLHAASAMGLSLAGVPALSLAQGGPVEGTNYVKLSQAAPVSAPEGKVEVVEFFWYGCPHCYHFEPSLAAWVAKLPGDVVFRRVPWAYRENPFGIHQRLFYALEVLGLVGALHAKVFNAMHQPGGGLRGPDGHATADINQIADFLGTQGVDRAKFLSTYNSFGVQTKARQARTLAEAYRIDGVPTVGIGGQFTTSVSLNDTAERTLATMDFLINRLRKAR